MHAFNDRHSLIMYYEPWNPRGEQLIWRFYGLYQTLGDFRDFFSEFARLSQDFRDFWKRFELKAVAASPASYPTVSPAATPTTTPVVSPSSAPAQKTSQKVSEV